MRTKLVELQDHIAAYLAKDDGEIDPAGGGLPRGRGTGGIERASAPVSLEWHNVFSVGCLGNMAMRCAACGNRAPDAPGPAQLPDPDGIQDAWREHWDREESTPRYTYSPSTTCNGCWGWLVDTDTNTMVWQGVGTVRG